MNVLYLSPWFPFPPTNGSELRINALLCGLAAHHAVTLLSFQRRPLEPHGQAEAHDLLEDVRLVPWREFDPTSRRARLGYFSPKPRSIIDTYSVEMAGHIRRAVESNRYNVAIISQIGIAHYIKYLEGIPVILDEIELGHYQQITQIPASLIVNGRRHLMWAKMRAYVRGLLPHFAAATVVSERERLLLNEIAPEYDAVRVIPNGVKLKEYSHIRAARDPSTLIFTGAFTYDVNYKAMIWFLEKVYPLVQQEFPAVRLVITGDHAGKSLPPAENVTLTGYIQDIKAAVAGAAVSVVPIQQGGGTRLKILEAMALGTPVVSTTKGAEGLAATHEHDILLADNPEGFASAVLRLLRDGNLRQDIVNNACQLVRQQYDWAIIMPEFIKLVEKVSLGKRSTIVSDAFIS